MPGIGPIIGLPSGPKVNGPFIMSFMPARPSAGMRSKPSSRRSAIRSRSGASKLVAESQRRASDLPRRRLRLVGAEQHALPLLAEIDVALVVDAGGQPVFRSPLDDLGDRLGDQVMVLHRLHRQIDAGKMTDLASPQAASIDDHFGMDRPLRGDDIPGAVGPLTGFDHRRVGVIAVAVMARRLSLCVPFRMIP